MRRNKLCTTYQIDEGDTIPRMLIRTAQLHWDDNKIALRHKRLGIWREYTWKEYFTNVKHFALGLSSLGLKQGDRVFLIGYPEPEGYWAAYGTLAAGGISIPMMPYARRGEIEYIVQQSDCSFVVAEDQEQVDKILEIKDKLPNVKKVIYWDEKGMWSYDDPSLMSFRQVLELGKACEQSRPTLFEEVLEAIKPDDIATLVYTSGTTGWPKGGIWTHKSLLEISHTSLQTNPFFEDERSFAMMFIDVSLGSLPAVIAGTSLNLAEAPDTIPRDIREVGWTSGAIVGLEQQASEMQVRISEASRLKRLAWQLLKPIGLKRADVMATGGQMGTVWKILYFIGYILVFRPILDKHGLSKARNPFVTATATSPEVLRLFHGMGVPVRNLYGQSEFIPISGTLLGEVDSETVGPPFPDREVRIAESGEILARGTCAEGYYKNPDVTAKWIDEKKWVHTGDAGIMTPDGRLVVLDRMTDLMTMRDGTVFSPLWIENKLKFSPYIRQAMVAGADKDFIAVLISFDSVFVKHWAEQHQLPYTSSTDLSQKPEVFALIQDDIGKRVNKTLPDKTKVKKFAILPKEMDIDDAEITRTWKLRRGYVNQRYGDLIEALYTDTKEYMLDIESTYEDGRKARVRVPVKIAEVEKEK